jgi:hypothetical protein
MYCVIFKTAASCINSVFAIFPFIVAELGRNIDLFMLHIHAAVEQHLGGSASNGIAACIREVSYD